ncbi:cysteine desulfurase family protein [Floricoccus penangensis]|uniref:cysteine desulfurase family protein n=1 Tax=Floricoccus penangensis TaxID=1859475 RepID=UPI00203AF76C|nr:cysteine desulfurase family protein [Floricoccus penangensis]URZ88018.1 cysteine desulfurase [Floricoccus penangensis]
MVYLDNAATTPMSPSVIDAMLEVMTNHYGNPSSIHNYGRDASKIIRQSRQTIADILEVSAHDIIFTSGGTEANNTALIGYALANQDKGRHIITTSIEHHSVLHATEYLKNRFGFEITYINPDENGIITTNTIKNALRDDTIIVSTMFANNETGCLLPIKEIGEALKDHQAVYHVDAVQVTGKIPVHPKELGIDFLSASAHKFHGPKGIGFLYSDSNKFDNLLHGGEQEDGHRPSTENIAGIVGMSQALKESSKEYDKNFSYIENLKEDFLKTISNLNFYKNEFGPTMPHVLNLGFPNQNQDMLLMKLDLAGIAISTGSACTAGAIEPSHVLSAIYGENSPKLKENVRISFSEYNTKDDVNKLANKLIEILGE